jgi:hypothetical protein
VSTVEPPAYSEERLENRLAFETLISDLSSRFFNLPPSEVDRGIEDALRRVCESLSIDYGSSIPGSCSVYEMYAPLQELVTPDAKQLITKGNYERLFDEARQRVRAWETENVK